MQGSGCRRLASGSGTPARMLVSCGDDVQLHYSLQQDVANGHGRVLLGDARERSSAGRTSSTWLDEGNYGGRVAPGEAAPGDHARVC
jgi:hypothetical protein